MVPCGFEWLPVFTRPDAVQFLLDSWTHLRQHDFGFEDYGALERHVMRSHAGAWER